MTQLSSTPAAAPVTPATSKAPAVSPVERIRELEKLCVTADLPAMLARFGDIHQDWDNFSQAQQADVRRLEAIFLTLLNARAKTGA